MKKTVLPFLLLMVLFVSGCKGQSDTQLSEPTTVVNEPTETKNEQQDTELFQMETEQIRTNDLLGKIDPSSHPDFKEVPQNMANRSGMWMHRSALAAFEKMREKAEKEGVNLVIISATRTFDQQKRIWEQKWTGLRKVGGEDLSKTMTDPTNRAIKILEYSSMPGTSRHHWGTDIDINSLNNDYFASGRGKKEYEWLRDNAHEFGFCQPYSEKGEERMYGYEMEKWHWSYIPLAKDYLKFYKLKIGSENLNGIEGSGILPFERTLEYVTGISSDCQ